MWTGKARSEHRIGQDLTRGRTGSLLDIGAAANMMGRNKGLPVSHLAEALLGVHPLRNQSPLYRVFQFMDELLCT